MTTPPFIVEVSGRFGPDDVRVRWRDEPKPSDPDLDALIERVWTEQTRAAERTGAILFNGPLARYLRHRVHRGVLTMDVGPTDYAHFLATNLLNHERGDEIGWERFSNPVGTSATVITSDGFLVFGRRNQRVAYHPGYLHTFGGALESADRREDGSLDAFASIRRELLEELGLRDDDVVQLVCLGLIRDRQIRQPELIFDAHVRQARDDLADRIDHGGDHEEHDQIEACPDRPDAILPFIRRPNPIAPIAVGALFAHGRLCFGDTWHRQTLSDLAEPPT